MVNNSTDERGEKMLRKTCLQELFLLCYLQVFVIGCKSKNYPPVEADVGSGNIKMHAFS